MTINLNISITGSIQENDSYNLNNLSFLIEEEIKGKVLQNKKLLKGAKDGGLTIGLSVIGVSLSAVIATINVINYWKSNKPKYSIKIINDDYSIEMNNLSKREFDKLISTIESNQLNKSLSIEITKTNENE